MKRYTVTENVEAILSGQKILLEKGDVISISERMDHGEGPAPRVANITLLSTSGPDDMGRIIQKWDVNGIKVNSTSYDGPTPPDAVPPGVEAQIIEELLMGRLGDEYPNVGETINIEMW